MRRSLTADEPNVYVRDTPSLFYATLAFAILAFVFAAANTGMNINGTVQLDKIEDCLDCKIDTLCGTGLDCKSNKLYGGSCPRWQLRDGTTCTTTNCFVTAINSTTSPTDGVCTSGTCVGGVCLGSCNTVADCPSGATLGIVDSTGSTIINSTAVACQKKVCIFPVYNNVTAIGAGPCLGGDAATEYCLNFALNSPYYSCLKASACQSGNGNTVLTTCEFTFACARTVF